MDGSLVIVEGSLLSRFCYCNGRILVITEGSRSLRFRLLQWMVALSLWKVVCSPDFWYKQLEDRLGAMEVQKVSGMDFGDLGW